MKLIIDISKNEYNDIVEQVKKCDYPDMGLGKIIANGKPVSTEGDLISREALKKACSEMVRGYINSDFIPCPTGNKAMELIDNAPTVVCEEREQGKCPYYAG